MLFNFYSSFDLKNTNVNDDNLDKMAADKIPDVVLVKKVYAEKSLRNRRRKWKLKHIDGLHAETASVAEDYNNFLEDLEEEPELRQNINIYKDAKKMINVDETEESGEEVPQVTLAEMMDDLVLSMES